MRPTLPTLTRRAARLPAVPRPLQTPGVANVAHRGASAYAPENTLAAIRKAVARDADQVEFDVQRTKDGELVLLHDLTLERTTDVRRVFPSRAPWRVEDFTHDELVRLDAGSWKAPEYAGERIPTLGEALDVLALSRVGALVELKMPGHYPGIVDEVAAVMRSMASRPTALPALAGVTVQSFDQAAMWRLKGSAPFLTVGVLGSPSLAQLPALSRWADQVNPHHRRADRAFVDRVHELGMDCLVWTVNRAVTMRRALELGVDGVITNRPDVLHQVRVDHMPSGR